MMPCVGEKKRKLGNLYVLYLKIYYNIVVEMTKKSMCCAVCVLCTQK